MKCWHKNNHRNKKCQIQDRGYFWSLGMKITECYSLHVGNYILRKKKKFNFQELIFH